MKATEKEVPALEVGHLLSHGSGSWKTLAWMSLILHCCWRNRSEFTQWNPIHYKLAVVNQKMQGIREMSSDMEREALGREVFWGRGRGRGAAFEIHGVYLANYYVRNRKWQVNIHVPCLLRFGDWYNLSNFFMDQFDLLLLLWVAVETN